MRLLQACATLYVDHAHAQNPASIDAVFHEGKSSRGGRRRGGEPQHVHSCETVHAAGDDGFTLTTSSSLSSMTTRDQACLSALKVARVKIGIPMLIVLGGLLLGHLTQAREVQMQRPHWFIVITVIDRRTGQKLKQSSITDPGLEFDDPAECQLILSQVHPVQSDHFTTVLTCQKFGSGDVEL
jgi:hypothetical protein